MSYNRTRTNPEVAMRNTALMQQATNTFTQQRLDQNQAIAIQGVWTHVPIPTGANTAAFARGDFFVNNTAWTFPINITFNNHSKYIAPKLKYQDVKGSLP